MRLILLHGWTLAGDVFAPLMAALPGATCTAPDLPGHGASGYAPNLQGAGAMLADMLQTDTADGPVVVLGWSMGALVAWDHVARHGASGLHAIISIDMSPRPLPDWEYGLSQTTPERACAQIQRFRTDWPDAARAIAAAMFANPEGAPTLSCEAAARRIAARDATMMVPFWEEIIAADHRATIASLPVPCLALHGAESRVYPPACADWIAQTAPKGQAVIVPQTGHAPVLEAPNACAIAITEFLESLT